MVSVLAEEEESPVAWELEGVGLPQAANKPAAVRMRRECLSFFMGFSILFIP
jgi:hypothetical protein